MASSGWCGQCREVKYVCGLCLDRGSVSYTYTDAVVGEDLIGPFVVHFDEIVGGSGVYDSFGYICTRKSGNQISIVTMVMFVILCFPILSGASCIIDLSQGAVPFMPKVILFGIAALWVCSRR